MFAAIGLEACCYPPLIVMGGAAPTSVQAPRPPRSILRLALVPGSVIVIMAQEPSLSASARNAPTETLRFSRSLAKVIRLPPVSSQRPLYLSSSASCGHALSGGGRIRSLTPWGGSVPHLSPPIRQFGVPVRHHRRREKCPSGQ